MGPPGWRRHPCLSEGPQQSLRAGELCPEPAGARRCSQSTETRANCHLQQQRPKGQGSGAGRLSPSLKKPLQVLRGVSSFTRSSKGLPDAPPPRPGARLQSIPKTRCPGISQRLSQDARVSHRGPCRAPSTRALSLVAAALPHSQSHLAGRGEG